MDLWSTEVKIRENDSKWSQSTKSSYKMNKFWEVL